MIHRLLESVVISRLFQGKVTIILGPRQVGKTTLVRYIASQCNKPCLWLNGDEPDVRERLTAKTSSALRVLIGDNPLVVIDEAQRIENIGLTLKLIVDNFPEKQIIVTGSSSLQISDFLNEPLTGRKYEFELFPISYGEVVGYAGNIEAVRLLEQRIIYGSYPEVITKEGREQELLSFLSNSYLYKDILAFQQVKKPAILEKLLVALALQIGSEVKYNEIAQLIGSDPATIERYIDLLEKSYVVFRLQSLSRNMRNEIKKGRKIYFYDTGIRNSLIKNFNPISMRQDTGSLWENFLMVERLKTLGYSLLQVNRYFWRTTTQQEIDYIEEFDGRLHAYEFKWNPQKKGHFPQSFLTEYPGCTVSTITPENFQDFLENGTGQHS